ncbi:MAG: hypothetical protein ABMB14_19455 [Myxococcota bacterium]
MRSWIGLVVVAGWTTGCVVVHDDPTNEATIGSVDVSWQVGPQGCEAAGVTDIAVDIGGVGGSFACDDEAASIDVPAGSYDLVLRGLDGQGIARYEGIETGIHVTGGQVTSVPTVVLSALPADVTVNWYFENGRLCSANEVDEVEATLFDLDDFATEPVTAPCDSSVLTIEDVQPGAYTLALLGRNAGGQLTWSGETEVTLDKGDSKTVEVQLVQQ